MRTCCKCQDTKDDNCFYPVSGGKYFDSLCKRCRNIHVQKWRKENHNKIIKQQKKYFIKNKEKIIKYKKEEYQKNIEKYKEKGKLYRKNNRKKFLEYAKMYLQNPKNKKRKNERRRERYKTDIKYKLECNLRNRIRIAIKRGFKSKTTINLLGCSLEYLKQHLESQFKPGMTWKNYGFGDNKWHIDHIKPCSSFDLSKPEEQCKCFNYKNLQPLWQHDNLTKSNKILSILLET
jgi:Prasinovirus endonuclease VII